MKERVYAVENSSLQIRWHKARWRQPELMQRKIGNCEMKEFYGNEQSEEILWSEMLCPLPNQIEESGLGRMKKS
jgi:hypothetical protein